MPKLIEKVRAKTTRALFAYIFMLSFILLTSIGAALIYPPAGLLVGGTTCGLFGYLLGRE